VRSLCQISDWPVGVPLLADDFVEFHAARLLLLINLCGVKEQITGLPRIEGLTKMAKLDFFVRYPQFFATVCKALNKQCNEAPDTIESAMVRYHYGPWDKRYYQSLGYLEGRSLIRVSHNGTSFELLLTETGKEIADVLGTDPSFGSLCDHMRRVKKVVGKYSGSRLKTMIYRIFEEEITLRKLGEEIK